MGPSKRRNSANDNGSGTMARRAVRGGNGFMLLMRVEKEKSMLWQSGVGRYGVL